MLTEFRTYRASEFSLLEEHWDVCEGGDVMKLLFTLFYMQGPSHTPIYILYVLCFLFFIVSASTLRVMGILTGCSVCGHSGRDDFTTQARLIYVGKAPRAPTESVERIRRTSTKLVMANQQLRPPTDRCQDQLRQSVRFDGMVCLL